MTKEDFSMWLQGWVELNDGAMPSEDQWEMIKAHLSLTFIKITPPIGGAPMPALSPSIRFEEFDPSRFGPGINVPAFSDYPFPYRGIGDGINPSNTLYC